MIYVIGENRTGIVKIGTAVNPQARLSVLQTGNPRPLRVLLVLPGGAREEGKLHRRFADRSIGGEWFDFGDDDAVVAVASVAVDDEPDFAGSAPRPRGRFAPGESRRAPGRPKGDDIELPPKAAPRDPERTLTCVLAAFAAHGEPDTLTTETLLGALRDGPDASLWQEMRTDRAATMALARDLRTCAGVRSVWLVRSSIKVPTHDGTGRFVNGWHRRDLVLLDSNVAT